MRLGSSGSCRLVSAQLDFLRLCLPANPRRAAISDNGATSNSAAAREFFRGLSAESRSVLGFPRVGSPYWNEETMRAVSQRYHGMDMTPYREGVASARL